MKRLLVFILTLGFVHCAFGAEAVRYQFKNDQYELNYVRTKKLQRLELKGRLTSYYSVGEGLQKLVKELLVPGPVNFKKDVA